MPSAAKIYPLAPDPVCRLTAVFFFSCSARSCFPETRYLNHSSPNKKLPGLEKIWLAIDSGKVEAWFLPPVDPQTKTPAPAVIFGHGNGELIDFWPVELERFTRLGMSPSCLWNIPDTAARQEILRKKSITQTFVAAYDDMLTSRRRYRSFVHNTFRSVDGRWCCLCPGPPEAFVGNDSDVDIYQYQIFGQKISVPAISCTGPV